MAVNPWRTFARNHPKAAKWVWQIGVFYLFSLAVTVLQYALFTFLPYLFGEGLASTAFMWPHIPISFAGIDYSWNVLGYGVARNAAGEVVIGGGLGYFLSYEIRSFVAQCVNFPLQRNVTFKSHGNVAYQILWYFIAWVLISLFCNAINGLWLPLAQARFDPSRIQSAGHVHHRRRVHGDLLLRIQDHLPGGQVGRSVMIVLPALGVAMVDDGLGTAVGQLRDQCAQGCGNDGEGDAEDGVLACVGGAVGKGRLAANALLPRHLEHLAERQSD